MYYKTLKALRAQLHFIERMPINRLIAKHTHFSGILNFSVFVKINFCTFNKFRVSLNTAPFNENPSFARIIQHNTKTRTYTNRKNVPAVQNH